MINRRELQGLAFDEICRTIFNDNDTREQNYIRLKKIISSLFPTKESEFEYSYMGFFVGNKILNGGLLLHR